MEKTQTSLSIKEKLDASTKPVRNTFLFKLVEILDEKELEDIISWDPTGVMVVIKNPRLLAQNVLTKYFDNTKYASFLRQLCFYGFRKTTKKMKNRVYYHPNFRRGRIDLLKTIERAHGSSKARKEAPAADASHSQSLPTSENHNTQIEELNNTIRKLQMQVNALSSYVENHIQECQAQKKMHEFNQLMALSGANFGSMMKPSYPGVLDPMMKDAYNPERQLLNTLLGAGTPYPFFPMNGVFPHLLQNEWGNLMNKHKFTNPSENASSEQPTKNPENKNIPIVHH